MVDDLFGDMENEEETSKAIESTIEVKIWRCEPNNCGIHTEHHPSMPELLFKNLAAQTDKTRKRSHLEASGVHMRVELHRKKNPDDPLSEDENEMVFLARRHGVWLIYEQMTETIDAYAFPSFHPIRKKKTKKK
jgi:hypothetical protein